MDWKGQSSESQWGAGSPCAEIQEWKEAGGVDVMVEGQEA